MPRQVRISALPGFASQASVSEAMNAASFSGGTVCGSRQGSAGKRLGPILGASFPVEAWMAVVVGVISVYSSRWGLQFEFRIGHRAHLGKVQAFQLGLGGSALTDKEIDDERKDEAQGEHETKQSGHTDQLGHKLAGVAIEETGHGAVDAVPRAAVVAFAVGKESQRNDTPNATCAVHRDGAYGVVHFQYAFDEGHGDTYQDASDQADDDRADWIYKAGRGGDGHQAGEEAVAGHGSVGFALNGPHVQHGADESRGAGEHGVHRDGTDAQVAVARSTERGAGIKAEPAEGQNQATRDHQDDIVGQNDLRLALARKLSDTRAENHGDGQRAEAADGVHDSRASKIAVALTETKVSTQVGEPPTAPGPVGEEWVGESCEQEGGHDESGELPPFHGSAGGDCGAGVHEYHLE